METAEQSGTQRQAGGFVPAHQGSLQNMPLLAPPSAPLSTQLVSVKIIITLSRRSHRALISLVGGPAIPLALGRRDGARVHFGTGLLFDSRWYTWNRRSGRVLGSDIIWSREPGLARETNTFRHIPLVKKTLSHIPACHLESDSSAYTLSSPDVW